MKKHLVLLFALMFVTQIVIGQARYFNERYVYTQYHLYPVLINPGATGATGHHQVIFNYRNKWASFEDSPRSFSASYDGDLGNRVGVGGILVSDKFGALNTTKGQLSFSYTIDTPTNKVGFGLATEYIRHNVSGSSFANPFIDTQDPLFLQRIDGNAFFDITPGIYGLYDDKISYGLVLPGLLSSELDEPSTLGNDSEFSYILNFGYKLISEANDIVFEPSIYIKQLNYVPLHIDLNLKAGFLEERLTGGITYSLGADERLGFLIGSKVNSLNFYYGYNVSRHEFQTYNNGSHEITVGFDIDGFQRAQIIPNEQ